MNILHWNALLLLFANILMGLVWHNVEGWHLSNVSQAGADHGEDDTGAGDVVVECLNEQSRSLSPRLIGYPHSANTCNHEKHKQANLKRKEECMA